MQKVGFKDLMSFSSNLPYRSSFYPVFRRVLEDEVTDQTIVVRDPKAGIVVTAGAPSIVKLLEYLYETRPSGLNAQSE